MRKKIELFFKGQLAKIIAGKRVDSKTWVFSSTNNVKFNYNSKYLFLYVLKHYPEINALFVINDDDFRKELTEQYGKHFCETNSLKGMIQVCQARVWFTSAGLPVYAFGLAKFHKIINLWHGVPLKTIALMEQKRSWTQKIYFHGMFSKNYEMILTTSKKLIPIMAQSFGVSENKIRVWGQPRNDYLNAWRINKKTIKGESFPWFNVTCSYDKVILYAPTYREDEQTCWFPFADWNFETFQKFLEEQQIILCLRNHLSEHGSCEKYQGSRILNLGSEIVQDITDALPLFDALITDYSSIYIDYLLLERPIIFLPYDKEKYLKERGMNFTYDAVTPGAKPQTMKDFMESIIQAFSSDPYKRDRIYVNHMLNEVLEPCSQKICENILRESREEIWV